MYISYRINYVMKFVQLLEITFQDITFQDIFAL